MTDETTIYFGGGRQSGRTWRISGQLRDLHITRYGRGLLGMPLRSRPSRGFRRHVRRAKARNHG